MAPTVESLEQELKAAHDIYLRALADFDNYRRRVERERLQSGKDAIRRFTLSLLDIVDDFERLLDFASTNYDASLVDRIRDLYQRLLKLLEAEGARPFESVGQPFDPSLHEAVATVPGGDEPPGTIKQEVRRGYRWDGELLRSARVVVAV
jgi:molecular chaperone GrpE